MNAGVISSRYAQALLKYVQETGAGEKVYSQACLLVERMGEVPKLAEVLQRHDSVMMERKLEIIETALGESLSPELKRFIEVLHTNRRIDYLKRMLHSFISTYRARNGIKVGSLVTASLVSGVREAIEMKMQQKTGSKVLLEERVDESLIGGFILQVDDLRLDASIDARFRRLRKELVEENDRLV